MTPLPTRAILTKSSQGGHLMSAFYESKEYQTCMDMTVEEMIDKLHSLASEGRIVEAKEIAQQIKELQKTAA